MFDPLRKDKLKLKQASINAELAKKYTNRQFNNAKIKSEKLISSPMGLVTMFSLGALSGMPSTKPLSSTSTLTSMLFKLF